jgi:hypothetical protein
LQEGVHRSSVFGRRGAGSVHEEGEAGGNDALPAQLQLRRKKTAVVVVRRARNASAK